VIAALAEYSQWHTNGCKADGRSRFCFHNCSAACAAGTAAPQWLGNKFEKITCLRGVTNQNRSRHEPLISNTLLMIASAAGSSERRGGIWVCGEGQAVCGKVADVGGNSCWGTPLFFNASHN